NPNLLTLVWWLRWHVAKAIAASDVRFKHLSIGSDPHRAELGPASSNGAGAISRSGCPNTLSGPVVTRPDDPLRGTRRSPNPTCPEEKSHACAVQFEAPTSVPSGRWPQDARGSVAEPTQRCPPTPRQKPEVSAGPS